MKAQILAGGRGKGVFSTGLEGGVKVTQEYVKINTKLYIYYMIHCECCKRKFTLILVLLYRLTLEEFPKLDLSIP